VINVAHFHNEPDESTRRAAFINHWNNAILSPQREKNGFIYIVYTNDKGQTSRGWLSKKDLKALGE
jgi:serine/threonine-protein kinase